MTKPAKERPKVHNPEYIRSISERLYRILLAEDDGGSDSAYRAKAADRMIAKDDDGGKKFSNRAGQYDRIVRHLLDILESKP